MIICDHPWQNQPKLFAITKGKKFESSLCSFGDMSQNVPGSPILKFFSKRNETLLRMLHMEVRILAKYVASPTESISSMATKHLNESSSVSFDGKEREDKQACWYAE